MPTQHEPATTTFDFPAPPWHSLTDTERAAAEQEARARAARIEAVLRGDVPGLVYDLKRAEAGLDRLVTALQKAAARRRRRQHIKHAAQNVAIVIAALAACTLAWWGALDLATRWLP